MLEAKFKLGQNRALADREGTIAGLERESAAERTAWRRSCGRMRKADEPGHEDRFMMRTLRDGARAPR
jgi:hypothetical protein